MNNLDECDRQCSICRELFPNSTHSLGMYTLSTIQPATSSSGEQPQPEEDLDIPLRLKVCGHVFGKKCIRDWLALSATCPLCRKDVQLPVDSAHPEFRLLAWRAQRESMMRSLIRRRTTASNSPLIIELAERAQAFIERETGMDKCPSRAMQLMCDAMPCDLMGMVNGNMVMRICHWDWDLDAGRLDLEVLGVSREELYNVIRVVQSEMGRCEEIAKAHGVEIWENYEI